MTERCVFLSIVSEKFCGFRELLLKQTNRGRAVVVKWEACRAVARIPLGKLKLQPRKLHSANLVVGDPLATPSPPVASAHNEHSNANWDWLLASSLTPLPPGCLWTAAIW
jgi:hypothetical protein